MTVKCLPPNASVRHLRNEAKSLLKNQKLGKPEVCSTFRSLPRLSGKSDVEILGSPIQLQEAQHALALEYGYGSWADLCRHLEAPATPAPDLSTAPGRRLLTPAVDMIHRLVKEEEHGGRNHLVHVLFAMRAAGWSLDCETLMCITGTAFSFCYQHDNFHVAYSLPRGWELSIAEATGFGYEYLSHGCPEDAWRHVVESIDSGRLVNGEWMEGVTFAGYEDADRVDDRRVFAIDETFEWPGSWWDWKKFSAWYQDWAKPFRWLARHSKRIATPSGRDAVMPVLERIPQWAGEKAPDRLPNAHFGLDGIRAYAEDIADMSKGTDFMIGPWRACHAIKPLWSVRRLPPIYLRRAAREFAGEAGKEILAAAAEYEAAYDAWQEWNAHLGDGCCRPGVDRQVCVDEAWDSPQRRTAGAAAVRRAYEHERAAVAEIRKAVAIVGG